MDPAELLPRQKERHQPVGVDPQRSEEARVGEPGGQVGEDDGLRMDRPDRARQRLEEGSPRRAVRLLGEGDLHADGEIPHQILHPGGHLLRVLPGKDPAVHRPLRLGGDHVRLESGRKRRHGEGVPEQGIDLRVRRRELLQPGRPFRAPGERVGVESDPSQGVQDPQHLPHRVGEPRRVAVLGDPRHRPGKPRRGVALRRTAAVAGPPFRREGKPQRPLLPEVHEEELPFAEEIPNAHAPLVHSDRATEGEGEVPDEILRSFLPSDLLVGVGHEEELAAEDPGPGGTDRGAQVGHPEPLRIQGAPAVQVSVLDLRGERRNAPLFRPRRHHVHVVDQDEPRLLGSAHVAQDVRFLRRGAERDRRQAVIDQDAAEQLRRRAAVPGRVRRVDPDVLRKQRDGVHR